MPGIHTVVLRGRERFSSARMCLAMCSATTSGVTDSGAGRMPSVIEPMTKPGRAVISASSLPCRRSARPWQKASSPAFVEPYT